MSIYDKLGEKTAGVKARQVEKPSSDRTPKTAPAIFLNASQRMDAAEAKVEELEAIIKASEGSAIAMEVVISDLIEVKGRRRLLTFEQFNELKENLRHNQLASAITVRKLTSGKFEILSGHNRVAAFRELGKDKILAVILDADDDQANLTAFYANLLQPNLPDFEKFLGFKMIKELRPNKKDEEIADESGISRTQVIKLLSFGSLPEEALTLLQNHQDAIGANAAFELAKSANKGLKASVVEAVKKVISKEMTQEQAVRFALSGTTNNKPATRSGPIIVRSGRQQYCSIYPTGSPKVFKLDFADPDEAREVMNQIKQLLDERAANAKTKNT